MSPLGRVRRFFDGSMRANAVALVANQLASALLGFVYWLLAARLYAVEVVGTSSAVISSIQLVSGIAQLGLVNGMQRFIPRAGRHARRLARSAYLVSLLSAAVSGVGALVLARIVAPDDSWFGTLHPAWVVAAAVAWTLFYLQDGVLIGLREAVWVFIENFAYNLSKIVLLVIGAQLLETSGIVASWFAPTPLAVALIGALIFGRLLRPERLRDHDDPAERVTAREIVTSVSADHLGGMVAEAALRLLPLLVVGLAGAAANAYFYQAWMISTVLGLVASGMANSFTAETAADRRRVGPNSRAILRSMSLLILPAALVVGLGAPLVLRIFGEAYAREGATLLRVLALAVVPVIVNTWYISYLRIVGAVRKLVAWRVMSSVALVGLSLAGLRYAGITGVGIAWLLSQAGGALYALADAGHVIRTAPGRDVKKRGALRRADWRFLLPVPHPRTVAVFADGDLARSAGLLDATLVDGRTGAARECDLAVIDAPSPAGLEACFASLGECGALYAEWRLPRIGGVSTIASMLARAGFDTPVMYWPAPRMGHAMLWVRVPTPGPAYRDVLRRLLEGALPNRTMGKALGALTLLALRIGFVPSVVTIAQKPCRGTAPCGSGDFCEWLQGALAEATGERVELMTLMRTGGATDENKVNWLVYAEGGRELRWIAKTARREQTLGMLEREHEVLERLGARDQILVKTPRAVLHTSEPGFPLFVQSALDGSSLIALAETRGYADAATLLASSLATLVDPADRQPRAAWWDAQVEPWLHRLAEQLEGLDDTAVAEQVREILIGLEDLPLGWTHNDCTPWNTLVTDSGLGMFDWETADEWGLPAVDLVYALSTTLFCLDGTEGTPRAIDSYRRVLEGSNDRAEAFSGALHSYAAALGLSAPDISRLRVMTWLLHTTHDLHNLLTKTSEPGSSLLGECVCLPVLRAEIARHRAEHGPLQGPAAGDVIVLSPHLDDAALSCGSAIRRLSAAGAKVTVVSVFTADLPDPSTASAYARRCHDVWGAGDRPFVVRVEEDVLAMKTLGADALHLGLLDAIYRTAPDGESLYRGSSRSGNVHEQDHGCLASLTARLGGLFEAHPGAVVFVPAAVGGHVDHVLTRRAAEQAGGGVRLVYYDEYPYLAWTAKTYEDRPAAGRVGEVRPSAVELGVIVEALGHYRSQIPGLFPSRLGRLRRILRERAPRLCSWLPASQGSFASAMRRMSARLHADRARVGERFHWDDESWAGPFGGDRRAEDRPSP